MRSRGLVLGSALTVIACSGGNNDDLGRELASGARDAAADAANVLDATVSDTADAQLVEDAGTLEDATALDATLEDAAPTALDASTPDADLPDASPSTVFSLDFEGALPANVDPGTGTLSSSDLAATLGPPGNQFGPTLLRSPTGNVVTVTLSNLPAHSSLTLDFLYAAIDSLDGQGSFPSGDYFRINLDAMQIFREAFANATADQVQTYNAPPGVTLARRVDLGFAGNGGYYTDSAYDMGADPQFDNIPHTASTAVITFTLEGEGVQTLDDESWGIDNIRVTANP